MKVKAICAAMVLAGYSFGCAGQGAVTYAITTFDLNNGVAVSSSSSYKLAAEVGDSFAAGSMAGGSFSLKAGFISQVNIAIPRSSATSLSFGNQGVSMASAPLAVTINNYGASVLNVTSIIPTGDFAVSASNCAAVASNGSCTVAVRFTPTVSGARTGTLTFAANAAISNVALSGTGVVNTQTITFGATPSVAVGSTGNVTATASSGLTPVTFASNSPSFCTVAGATVTGVSVGSCSITASQAGNAAYAAASNTLIFPVAAAGSGGGGDTGDVPLPAWALVLLAGGLIEAARRRRAA